MTSLCMKFIVKLSPEITIKSRPVRKQFVARLQANIRKICRLRALGGDVVRRWDMLEVVLDRVLDEGDEAYQQRSAAVAEVLRCTPGIAHFMEVAEHELGADVAGPAEPVLEFIAGATCAVYAGQCPGTRTRYAASAMVSTGLIPSASSNLLAPGWASAAAMQA